MPGLQSWFDVTGRRKRLEFIGGYFARMMVSFVSTLAIGLALWAFDGRVAGGFGPIGLALIALWIVAQAGLVLSSYCLSIQRLHDIGVSGWAGLLLLFPGINALVVLGLALVPGTRGKNRFGAPSFAVQVSS